MANSTEAIVVLFMVVAAIALSTVLASPLSNRTKRVLGWVLIPGTLIVAMLVPIIVRVLCG